MPHSGPRTVFSSRTLFGPVAALSVAFATAATADPIETMAGPMTVTSVVEDLDAPWSFGWLPDGTILVTERGGRLLSVKDGETREIGGLPDISVDGQGGLLDILIPSDFAQTREIFFTFARDQFLRGNGTAVYRATLSQDGSRLEDGETIFAIARGTGGGFHFGSRIVESPDGYLFVTVGDRGNPDQAQDLSMHNGSVLRIDRNGDAPADNPFVDTSGAQGEIWSYGHRNPQGMAFDASGQLWVNEHGARGGDEVNRIEKGANYGWPVIAYGVNYDGSSIGIGREQAGMEQPVHYWDPSIAPSGMTFYDGVVADWDGNAFVGSLKFDYIARLDGDPLTEVEQISGPETLRVRDVRQGPDGALWFLSVGHGALYRLAPDTNG
ncbi:PQQ-dependent sugar dehydrogenase [Cognatishimia sp. F0-27]|uniref:PQQ-dependent sugar dehydrogenase n=1 Tax=Cognatishimia sp. F0-27 TaxID=2816855 RepID=UPI001D0BF929|nr:PQQ-dependent sugar dehydrogenase [Cognatishimia sp. F0-27]MCC1492675.1 PQQ-dependent sugar dehydrogenase [Cognatishimia sp. F0-27]